MISFVYVPFYLVVTAGLQQKQLTEFGIFAADMVDFYKKYAKFLGFEFNIIEQELQTPTTRAKQRNILGASKTIIKIEGENVYEAFKYESGTHIMQRNPVGVTGKMVSGYAKITCIVSVNPIPSREDISLNSKNLNFKSNPGSYQMVHLPTGM